MGRSDFGKTDVETRGSGKLEECEKENERK